MTQAQTQTPQYVVTRRGSYVLIVNGERPAEGTLVDTAGWQTLPTLVAQGLLQKVTVMLDTGEPLWEGFPQREVLLAHDVRTVQAVHYLTDRQLEDLPEIGEAGVRAVRKAVALHRGQPWPPRAPEGPALVEALQGGKHLYSWHGLLEGENDFVVLVADNLKAAAAVRSALGFLLEPDEFQLLELSDAATELNVEAVLESLREGRVDFAELSGRLTTLLERLGLTYPPPTPEPAPAEPEVQEPAELELLATDPEASLTEPAAAAAELAPEPPQDDAPKGKKRPAKG